MAFYLRIDQTGLPQAQQRYVYLLAPLLAIPVFVRFGLYRAIFRYTGMAALATTAKAVAFMRCCFSDPAVVPSGKGCRAPWG